MPTTREPAAPRRVRIESYEEERDRLEAIKLDEHKKVMRV